MRSIRHLYNKRAKIVRPDRAQAGAGFPETTTTVATDVPCRRSPMSAGDQDYAASVQVIANHAIYFDAAVDVQRDDIITIGDVSYEARAFIRPSDEIYRKVLVEESQVGT